MDVFYLFGKTSDRSVRSACRRTDFGWCFRYRMELRSVHAVEVELNWALPVDCLASHRSPWNAPTAGIHRPGTPDEKPHLTPVSSCPEHRFRSEASPYGSSGSVAPPPILWFSQLDGDVDHTYWIDPKHEEAVL
jgi:hypothetical protein